MLHSVSGVLLLDKPVAMTSNAALQTVKRLFKAKKAGHTGSLDPIATGMLPICFGEATKFSQYLLESDKYYQVVVQLGVRTTTGDTEGEVIATKAVPHLSVPLIDAALNHFLGEIEQLPPMFSALKHQGQPLYKLARQGIEVERKKRRVTIFSLRLVDIANNKNQMTLSVHCSKGTYIRTLVEDISHKLGTEGHVIELRRTRITPYGETGMQGLSQLQTLANESGTTALHATLLPIESIVRAYPAVMLSEAASFYLRMGQAVRIAQPLTTVLVRLISQDARFLGIGEVMQDGRIKPHRLLTA